MASIDYPGQLVFNAYMESSLDDVEDGYFYSFSVESALDDTEDANEITFTIESDSLCEVGAGGVVTYYFMRAVDPDCPTLTYVSWVVQDQPDITGAQYVGARCGASALTDVTIAAKWQV